jgi:hypothetical protein
MAVASVAAATEDTAGAHCWRTLIKSMGCPIKTLQNPGGEKIYDENIIEEAVTFLKNKPWQHLSHSCLADDGFKNIGSQSNSAKK